MGAIEILENGGKKFVASDRMFLQIIKDYKNTVSHCRNIVKHVRRVSRSTSSETGKGEVDTERFRKPPCYICGYNGHGYYQPETHSCAAGFHKASAEAEEPIKGYCKESDCEGH